jgi:hypothetical protein
VRHEHFHQVRRHAAAVSYGVKLHEASAYDESIS